MSLQLAAQHLAAHGRGPDTALVHMAPHEIEALQKIAQAHGGTLTTNPHTGLPEAGFLSSILPMIAGAVLGPIAGPILTPLLVGGVTAAGTGSLTRGLMAGLGAYGGAGLGSALSSMGTNAAAEGLAGAYSQTGANLASRVGQAIGDLPGSTANMFSAAAGETPFGLANAAPAGPTMPVAPPAPITPTNLPSMVSAPGPTTTTGLEALKREIISGGAQQAAPSAGVGVTPGVPGPSTTPMPTYTPNPQDIRFERMGMPPPASVSAALESPMKTGLSELVKPGGADKFISALGGTKGALTTLGAAAAPIVFGGGMYKAVPTSAGNIQYYDFDNTSNHWTYRGSVPATDVNKAGGYEAGRALIGKAQGGLAAYADGGVARFDAGGFANQEIADRYAAVMAERQAQGLIDPSYDYGPGYGVGARQMFGGAPAPAPVAPPVEVPASPRDASGNVVSVAPTPYTGTTRSTAGLPASLVGSGYFLGDDGNLYTGMEHGENIRVATLTPEQRAAYAEQAKVNPYVPGPYSVGPVYAGADATAVTAPVAGSIGASAPTPTPTPSTTPGRGIASVPTVMGDISAPTTGGFTPSGGTTALPTTAPVPTLGIPRTPGMAPVSSPMYGGGQGTIGGADQITPAYQQFWVNAPVGSEVSWAGGKLKRVSGSQAVYTGPDGKTYSLSPGSDLNNIAANNPQIGELWRQEFGFVPKNYVTGASEKAYSYLMGQSNKYPVNQPGIIQDEYAAAALGLPHVGKYIPNYDTGKMELNPNYKEPNYPNLPGGSPNPNAPEGMQDAYNSYWTANKVGSVVDFAGGKLERTGDTAAKFTDKDGKTTYLYKNSKFEDIARASPAIAALWKQQFGYEPGGSSSSGKTDSSTQDHFKKGGLSAVFAAGGMSGYNLGDYSDGGRLLKGPGDGVSDDIPATIGGRRPARLADGEFVVPARIVSELGNGSTEAGARKLYAMMDRIQKNRRKTVGKGNVAVNSRADKYLPA